MGRIIGLISCTCLVLALMRGANLQHNDGTLLGTKVAKAQLDERQPREQFKLGREMYLRGRYADAIPFLEVAAKSKALASTAQRQAAELLQRSRDRLTAQFTGQKPDSSAVIARAQSPFEAADEGDDFAAAEREVYPRDFASGSAGEEAPAMAGAALPEGMVHAARTRVERLMALATTAAKRGDKNEALKLATQAQQIVRDARLTFPKKEVTPAQFLARLQGGPAATVAATAAADAMEWAEEGVQTAAGVADDAAEIAQVGATTDDPFADAAMGAAPEGKSLPPAKDQALDMIRSARADLKAGRFEDARTKALQAEQLDVAYDLFDDRPELVLADVDRLSGTLTLAKTTPATTGKPTPKAVAAAGGGKDESPKSRALRLVAEAREDMQKGNFESARVKAAEAEKLNVAFKLFEDRPELVLAELDATRASEMIAQSPQQGQPKTAPNADVDQKRAQGRQLLASARQLVDEGRIDEARRKAVEAEQLGLTYGPFDDRPEIVLADIARVAGRGMPIGPNTQVASKTTKPEATGVMPAAVDGVVQTASADPFATQANPATLAGIETDSAELSPVGLPASELFNRGLYELDRGNRDAAYQAFLAAHQTGERLDFTRQQRLQDFLRELAPRRSNVQHVNHQLAQADTSAPGADPLAMTEGEAVDPAMQGSPADTLLAPEPGAPSTLDVATQQESVKYDRIRNEVLNSVFKAERVREKDPEKAVEIIDQAMASVEGAALAPEATATLMKTLQRTRSSLESTVEQQRPNIEQNRKNKEVETQIEIDLQNKIRIEQEFAKLVDEYNDLMDQRRFAEAEVTAKKAKELNPREPAAETMFWKARISRRVDFNDKLKLDKEESFINQLNDVERAAVVEVGDDQPMKFGDNWAELSKRRKGSFRADNRKRSPKEEQILDSLGRQISLHEDAAPLREVMSKIATVAGIDIVLDEVGLEEEGATTDAPITISVDNVSVKSALNLVLERYALAYVVQDEVLKVTSRLRQQGEMEVRSYPVADLVVPIPSFTSTNSGMLGATNAAGVPMIGGAGQMSIPAMGAGMPQIGPGNVNGQFGPASGSRTAENPASTAPDFDALTNLITMTISPTSWMENGGTATIKHYETTLSLVIRQTQRVHEEIADLLAQLRRLQDLQVTVEVRFVTVTDRFFERIGIDFDFNIQDTAGDPSTDNNGIPLPNFGAVTIPQQGVSTTGTAQNGNQGGQNAQGGQQNQTGTTGTGQFFQQQPTRNTINRDRYPSNGTIVGMSSPETFSQDLDVPFRQGSFEIGVPDFGGFQPNAGLQMGLAILSDIEAFFFIQAAQGDERSNLMFAPKVTLFNGQTGFVTSSVNRPFVVSVTPTVGFGSVGFAPVIETLSDGVTLSVTAVISADRRFVRLTLRPIFTTITDVFTFSFQSTGGAQAGGQTGQGGQQGIGQGGAGGGGIQGAGGQQFGIGGGMGSSMLTDALFTQTGVAGNVGGNAGGNAGNVGNQTAAQTVTVQQPVQELVTVITTVSVPDGGTVLLGGVKRLREGRNMAGVPILNKIPYVSRLFKNTGVGRETESLMLMVTPRIIIQEEEEQLLGIPLE